MVARFVTAVAAALVSVGLATADDVTGVINCAPNGGTYTINKAGAGLHADLRDGFCTRISGNLEVRCSADAVTPEDQRIYNLTFLSRVTQIDGYLSITDCDHLESLAGLESLTTILGARASSKVPSLEIRACKKLKNIKELEGLTEISQGQPSVRITEGNTALCYHDLMPWSDIVANSEDGSAGGLALDKLKVDLFVQGASCLEQKCDASCFCGSCGGPGICLGQAGCEENKFDTPDWVLASHDNKVAYAFIIIFASLGSVLAAATLVGCILGKVKAQVLITFQKPPKKIRPALRPTPFGGGAQNPGITQWQPGMQQQQDLPGVPMGGNPGAAVGDAGAESSNGSRDVSRLDRPQSTGAGSVISLPNLKNDQQALTITRENSAAGTSAGTPKEHESYEAEPAKGTQPQKKISLEAAVAVEQAANRFVTPGQVEKIGEPEPENDEQEADMICPTNGCGKVAEFVCSRCGKQGYCSSSCQRAHWKIHREDCKRWTKEARAKRVSQARRRSSLQSLSGSAGSKKPNVAATPTTPVVAEDAAPAKPQPAAAAPAAPAAAKGAAEASPVPPVPAANEQSAASAPAPPGAAAAAAEPAPPPAVEPTAAAAEAAVAVEPETAAAHAPAEEPSPKPATEEPAAAPAEPEPEPAAAAPAPEPAPEAATEPESPATENAALSVTQQADSAA